MRVDHLLGVYSFGEGQGTGLLIIYAATATGGELAAADDATEVGVFESEALLHDRLHDPDRPIVVAEIDGAVGGVALLGMHQAPRGWYATLDDLAVATDLRRRGAGKALVGATAEIARERGCALLQLAFPGAEPAARDFLAACGFGAGEALALHL